MNHAELLEEIRARAGRLRLRVFWVPNSAAAGIRGTACGWPDLTIAGPGGHVFREVKSDWDETTPAQDAWGWALSRENDGLLPYEPLGISRWDIWERADLDSGRIDIELRAIAGLPLKEHT